MNLKSRLVVLSFSTLLLGVPFLVGAATLSVGPTSGSFVAGSTFDVSVYLDTKDESINALQVFLGFPPDKLQIVSQSAGQSIVGVWTSQPKFNNQQGRVELQGGVPGGINVSNGLVFNVTFRVRQVGQAILKFLDGTRILSNDGLGTDVLKQTQNGVYDLTLPAPQGPIVASKTHSNESQWYANPNVILDWVSEFGGIEGYSYVLNDDPVTVPDNISEGVEIRVAYKNLSDDTYYFHIKSLRSGVWGGVTHFGINIDTSPPADFKIEVTPYARTVRKQPIVEFFTTDAMSGIDHYELKLIPLNLGERISKTVESITTERGNELIFFETQSPYILEPLELGKYDVIIRVYDKAGNYREVMKRIEITQTVFEFIGDEGIFIRSRLVIPWFWAWVIAGILIIGLFFGGKMVKEWHEKHHFKLMGKELPGHLRSQLEELKGYRKKYGKVLMILLVLGSLWLQISQVSAAVIAPPLVTNISRDISNEEIFYVGGKTDIPNGEVIIYFQNLESGETISETVASDRRGDWFYRHSGFLTVGNYLLWTQTRLGDETSPPSPQIQMTVNPTAIQFGASRLSYQSLYFILFIIVLIVVIGLLVYIIYHGVHGRKKYVRFMKEVKEAEESVRRGFAVLRRDIQAELAIVHKSKTQKVLGPEEKAKEEQMLKDLEWVEKYISKEVWDIEHTSPNS
ncbi:MAG: cohesin domain-containing protein [Patescibacteria group bacterium]